MKADASTAASTAMTWWCLRYMSGCQRRKSCSWPLQLSVKLTGRRSSGDTRLLKLMIECDMASKGQHTCTCKAVQTRVRCAHSNARRPQTVARAPERPHAQASAVSMPTLPHAFLYVHNQPGLISSRSRICVFCEDKILA